MPLKKAYLIILDFFQFGVDIFFLLSGLGCCYSFEKKKSIGQFYLKRLRRIIPSYILIISVWCIYVQIMSHEITIHSIVENYTLITFFTRGVLTEWFIAAILTLYLVFPILYRIVNKDHHTGYYLIAGIYLFSFLASFLIKNHAFGTVNRIFISRSPSFVFGMILYHKICGGGERLRFPGLLIGFGALICFVLLKIYPQNILSWFERALLGPIAVSFVLGYSKWLNAVARGKEIKGLKFVGGITLEVYLIHEKIRSTVEYFVCKVIPNEAVGQFLSQFVAMLTAVFLAYIANKIVSLFLKCFNWLKSKSGQRNAVS